MKGALPTWMEYLRGADNLSDFKTKVEVECNSLPGSKNH